MLNLPSNPKLQDFQKYVQKLEKERGFDSESISQKCLLMGEEIGELFKAIRKQDGIHFDQNSKDYHIDYELADVFIYLCAIANRYNIDLEKAFREKEEINKQRTWVKNN
jgi:NTP pyrophosphatase (non-canonical NTP hydrolase)